MATINVADLQQSASRIRYPSSGGTVNTQFTGTLNISPSATSSFTPYSSNKPAAYSSALPTTTTDIANAIFGGASSFEVAALQIKASSDLASSSSSRAQASMAKTITGMRTDNAQYGWSPGVVGSSSFKVKDANGNWVDLETYYDDKYDSNPYTDVFSVKNVLNNTMEKVYDMYTAEKHLTKTSAPTAPTTCSSPASAGETEDIAITPADIPSGEKAFNVGDYITAKNIGIAVAILGALALLSLLFSGD